MPAPVTKPGMRAENPTPLPAYSTRRLWVAAASPAFAAAYGPPVGKWPEAGEGTNVDYVAAAAGHQPGEHLSDQLERYQKIERDDLAELDFGVAGVGRGHFDAGVVDEEVDGTSRGVGFADQSGDGIWFAEIGYKDGCRPALGPHCVGNRVECDEVTAGEHEVDAAGSQRLGDVAAQATGSAGDQAAPANRARHGDIGQQGAWGAGRDRGGRVLGVR